MESRILAVESIGTCFAPRWVSRDVDLLVSCRSTRRLVPMPTASTVSPRSYASQEFLMKVSCWVSCCRKRSSAIAWSCPCRLRIALKLRRAEERFIPQSTRAASFKRLLGGPGPVQRGGRPETSEETRDKWDTRAPHELVCPNASELERQHPPLNRC